MHIVFKYHNECEKFQFRSLQNEVEKELGGGKGDSAKGKTPTRRDKCNWQR